MATMQQVKKKLGFLILLLLVAATGTADGVCVDLVDVQTTLSTSADLVATFVASDKNNDELWRRTLGRGTSGSFGPAVSSYQFVAANSGVDMCNLDPCRLTFQLENAQATDLWIPSSVRLRGYNSDEGLLGERTFTVIPPELVNRDSEIVIDQC